jgi:hypothetical protein
MRIEYVGLFASLPSITPNGIMVDSFNRRRLNFSFAISITFSDALQPRLLMWENLVGRWWPMFRY